MQTGTSVTYGSFSEPSEARREYLVLAFSPLKAPLQERWRNNGLSADFLADFVTTFFPKDQHVPGSERRQKEIRSAVSYIANELLENAMKFHKREVDFPITLHLELQPDRVALHATNGVGAETGEAYLKHIQAILDGDAGELLMKRLEENALSESDSSSGLGLLTMLNDYGASLGWKFVQSDETDGMQIVTTQVELAV